MRSKRASSHGSIEAPISMTKEVVPGGKGHADRRSAVDTFNEGIGGHRMAMRRYGDGEAVLLKRHARVFARTSKVEVVARGDGSSAVSLAFLIAHSVPW